MVFAAVNKSIIMSVKSSSVFTRAKLLILSCAMEEQKTDLILFIWLKLRSPVQLDIGLSGRSEVECINVNVRECSRVHCFSLGVTGVCIVQKGEHFFHFEIRLDPTREITYQGLQNHQISRKLEQFLI